MSDDPALVGTDVDAVGVAEEDARADSRVRREFAASMFVPADSAAFAVFCAAVPLLAAAAAEFAVTRASTRAPGPLPSGDAAAPSAPDAALDPAPRIVEAIEAVPCGDATADARARSVDGAVSAFASVTSGLDSSAT